MRELLATIHIYSQEQEDGSASRQVGEREYEINFSPKMDVLHTKMAGAEAATKTPIKLGETTLAHELGHIVSMIMKDPSHSPIYQMLAQIGHDASVLAPAERSAWENARKIYPKLDTRVEVAAIRAIEKGGL